jgi:hypothetical protein
MPSSFPQEPFSAVSREGARNAGEGAAGLSKPRRFGTEIRSLNPDSLFASWRLSVKLFSLIRADPCKPVRRRPGEGGSAVKEKESSVLRGNGDQSFVSIRVNSWLGFG